jgi:hypothetical protein
MAVHSGPLETRKPESLRLFHRPGGRVRGRGGHRLAVRERDGRAAVVPRPEATQGGPGREEGRVRLRRGRRHAHPARRGRRGPALLLRQAQEARDEPAGHRQSQRRHPVGAGSAARLGPRQESGVDLGRPARARGRRAGHPWPTRATATAPGRRSRTAERGKPEPQKEAIRALAKLRAPGERANAQLKSWRILRELRCCPWRAGQLAKAIHALEIHAA